MQCIKLTKGNYKLGKRFTWWEPNSKYKIKSPPQNFKKATPLKNKTKVTRTCLGMIYWYFSCKQTNKFPARLGEGSDMVWSYHGLKNFERSLKSYRTSMFIRGDRSDHSVFNRGYLYEGLVLRTIVSDDGTSTECRNVGSWTVAF